MMNEIILGICLTGVYTEQPLDTIYLDQDIIDLIPCGESDLIITTTSQVIHER